MSPCVRWERKKAAAAKAAVARRREAKPRTSFSLFVDLERSRAGEKRMRSVCWPTAQSRREKERERESYISGDRSRARAENISPWPSFDAVKSSLSGRAKKYRALFLSFFLSLLEKKWKEYLPYFRASAPVKVYVCVREKELSFRSSIRSLKRCVCVCLFLAPCDTFDNLGGCG